MSELTDHDLARAVAAVVDTGVGLDEAGILAVLRLPDNEVAAALDAAHQVRMRWCGPEVEVEGIVSVKTGGCPEDCHFCSQSGLFTSPVRAVWLDIPALVEISPTTAVEGALVTDLAPRHQTTEAFTWSGTAIYLGFALGSGLAAVVMSGTLGSGSALTMAITLAIGLCAVGTVLALAGRRALARRPYGGEPTPAYAH